MLHATAFKSTATCPYTRRCLTCAQSLTDTRYTHRTHTQRTTMSRTNKTTKFTRVSNDQCQSGPPPLLSPPPTFQTLSYFTRPSFLPFEDPTDCGSMSLSSDEILHASRRHPPSLLSSNGRTNIIAHACVQLAHANWKGGFHLSSGTGSFRRSRTWTENIRAAGFIGWLMVRWTRW